MTISRSTRRRDDSQQYYEAQAEAERRRRQLAQLQFGDFIRRVNPRYQHYWHCQRLIGALQRVADGECKRLMVFMPPRHSKSETTSRLFPAYYMLRNSGHMVGLASYSANLAYGFSRMSRDYYRYSGGAIRPDAGAVGEWLTTGGGGLWATGVDGPLTGRGGHLLIVDDPLKDAKEAGSALIRNRQQDWWSAVAQTRLEPNAAVVLVMTRWNEADLAGWLLSLEEVEPEGWHIVRMPALAEPIEEQPKIPASCTLEPDPRQPGEALCEERYPAAKLTKIRNRIKEYWFGSLYQQRPAPKGGGQFAKQHFKLVEAASASIMAWVRYWDLAGSDSAKADYTVGLLMARLFNGTYLIADVVRGQWAEADRDAVILQTAQLDRQRRGHVQIYIEEAPGLSRETTNDLIRQLAGFSVAADRPDGDKASRAGPLSSQAQAGNLLLLLAPWNEAFINELTSFPNAGNDDQVDAASGSFNRLAELPSLAEPEGIGATTNWGNV